MVQRKRNGRWVDSPCLNPSDSALQRYIQFLYRAQQRDLEVVASDGRILAEMEESSPLGQGYGVCPTHTDPERRPDPLLLAMPA